MPNVARVRSALFTPGTEAARLRKAVTSAADVCIFDLEDSVPFGRVAEARGIVGEALRELDAKDRLWVRVHPASMPAMLEDLSALPLDRIGAIVLPKVGGAAELARCRTAILSCKGPAELPVVPIIESASGVVNLGEVASAPQLFCLALGRFDLSADLGVDPDGGSQALLTARAAIVLHSAAHSLQPPLDSPWLAIDDLDGLRHASQRARADGFGGMLLIHPSHVALVNEIFSPTAEEIAWAKDIMVSTERAVAEGRGAYAKAGGMVDEAIVRRARGILAQNGGSQ